MRIKIILFLFFYSTLSFCQSERDYLLSIYKDNSLPDSTRYQSLLDYSKSLLSVYPDSAIIICENALEEIKAKDLPKIEIDMLNLIGYAWGIKGSNENQIDYYEQCLRLSEENEYGYGICRYYVNMGIKYSSEDNFNNAIDLFKQSLKISEKYGIHDEDNLIYNNLGLSYYSYGDYTNALKYYFKALSLNLNKGDLKQISTSYDNVAKTYTKTDDLQSALSYQLKNIEIANSINDNEITAHANLNIASTYFSLKELDLSMKHLLIARDNFTLTNNTRMLGITHLLEGRIYVENKSYNAAKIQCEKASRLLNNDINIDYKIETCDCLSSAYKGLGKYKDAIVYMEQSYDLSKGRDKIGALKKLEKTEFKNKILADSLKNVAKTHALEMSHQAELRKNNIKKNILTSLIIIILILVGLYSRIRYIRRTNRELKIAMIKAEESEHFKQQFLANMSHEIRTPMNAVLGMTNLTLDTKLTSKQKKYLDAIKSSSKNLLVIINDILDLSKLEAGKMELKLNPFSVKELIKQVVSTLRYKAEEKGLKLKTHIAKDVPDNLLGDSGRLIQILLNLCGNAIKFTEKGSVVIEVSKLPDSEATLQFKVTDTGIGIPEFQQSDLFDAFHQGDISTSRRFGGTGLGLTISKTLIEMQNGSIEVESEVGKGSIFTFIIPFTIASLEEIKVNEKVYPTDFSTLKGIKLLIAEDNEYNQIVINDTLEHLIEDVKISIANNGKIAVEMLKEDDYDIILMDVQMPEMNGLEATKYIRENLKGEKKNIPIIALTASVLLSDLNKCIEAGMNSFIPKPFKREELLAELLNYYSPDQSQINNKKIKQKEVLTNGESKQISNLDYLRDFCEGDEKRIKKYVDLYSQSAPQNVEKIKSYLKNDDYTNVKLIIHSMKPHFTFMGMDSTRVLAEEIEDHIVQNADKKIINKLIYGLEELTNLSLEELNYKLS